MFAGSERGIGTWFCGDCSNFVRDVVQPVCHCSLTICLHEYASQLLCSGRVARLFPAVSNFWDMGRTSFIK